MYLGFCLGTQIFNGFCLVCCPFSFLTYLVTINDLLNSGLNNQSGAIAAGESGHVHLAAPHIEGVLVYDGVHLRMANYFDNLNNVLDNER